MNQTNRVAAYLNVLTTTTLCLMMLFIWHKCLAENSSNEEALPMKVVSSESVKVIHKTIEIGADFDIFTGSLESILGRFDPRVAEILATDPSAAEAKIKDMAGEQGLMIFGSQNHGALFALIGRKLKAKRYHIGNPLIAVQMTSQDIRAGLYAPMTVLVYEVSPMKVRVDFDLPSSMLGQFQDQNINNIAAELDMKLEKAIESAARLSIKK